MLIKIADLTTNLFVRKSLDHAHALMLSNLLKSGTKLPPIRITRDKRVIDGRHRIEAHHILGRVEIEAVYDDSIKSDVDLISKAFVSNTGGALPPTQADIEHTVSMLIERNVPKRNIANYLGMPYDFIRESITRVESKINRQRLQWALEAIAEDGKTVAAAAEEYGVEAEKVREHMRGAKKREKKNGVENVKRQLTSRYRSHGGRNANMLRALLAKYEEGDVTASYVSEIFSHLESLNKTSARTIADWKKRFDAKGTPKA